MNSERFWSQVARSDDGCWEWTGRRKKNKKQHYGLVRVYVGKRNGRSVKRQFMAHRVAWELTNGPIPAGLFVCHHCDNPPCVRLDHLFLGTHKDNAADAQAKGRLNVPHPRISGALKLYWARDPRADRHRARVGVAARATLARKRHGGRGADNLPALIGPRPLDQLSRTAYGIPVIAGARNP